MADKILVAAGFVIFRNVNKHIQYLLLQTSYGINHWTPPKGHVDPGETEIETAYRETKEEAGISQQDLRIVDGFQKVLNYTVKGGKPKKVIYWLAELRDPNGSITLSNEHRHYEWLGLEEAVDYSKFVEMQETLREADKFIRNAFKL